MCRSVLSVWPPSCAIRMVFVKRGNQIFFCVTVRFTSRAVFVSFPLPVSELSILTARLVNSSALHEGQVRGPVTGGRTEKQCLAVEQRSENHVVAVRQKQTQPVRRTHCRCFLCRYDESCCLLPFSAGFPLTLGYLHIPTGGTAVQVVTKASKNSRVSSFLHSFLRNYTTISQLF